jgi:DNA-binding MarR family transcriptional regulator
MESERRPIGYWLKHLDRLIDQAFERALDADGLTRRQWQVLNTLAAGPTTNAALTAALQPFVQGDSMAIEVVINDFLGRGWVRNVPDGGVEISERGRAAHEAAMQRVAETRQALRRGITEDEYVSVIRILQRMASNLELGAGVQRPSGSDPNPDRPA